MGVIRNHYEQRSNATAINDEWLFLSSDGEESVPNSNNNLYVNCRRRNQHSRSQKAVKPEPTFIALGTRGKSHKKTRRYANANLGMTELGTLANESELEAVSINDFIPQTTSPFVLLLKNLDQIKNGDLNDFLNCTEDEQNELLGNNQFEIELQHCALSKDIDSEQWLVRDSRECFSQIDPQIRKQLIRNHIPLGILSSIEVQIVEFFQANPRSLYKVHFKSSYQRFLLHACCQYLDLNCQSIDLDGQRLSQVKNNQKYFLQPQPFQVLSKYLEMI